MAIRDAVIAGKVDEARSLAGQQPSIAPDDELLAAAHERLREPYAAIAASADVGAAARAVAELTTACGACHTQRGVEGHAVEAGPPRTGMEHNQAGVAWMWGGLVGPSEPLFTRGVALLEQAHGPDADAPAGARALQQQLDRAVQRAARSSSRQRTRAFAEALATCAACHTLTGAGPAPTVQPAVPDSAPLIADMHQRFAVLVRARDAVSAGDLDAARDAGAQLASLEPPTGLPDEPWRPWMAELRADAQALVQASDAIVAAKVVVGIAANCGACHTGHGVGPSVDETSAEDLSAEQLLWIGLVGASDTAWGLGAERSGDPALASLTAEHERVEALAARLSGAR